MNESLAFQINNQCKSYVDVLSAPASVIHMSERVDEELQQQDLINAVYQAVKEATE